MKHISAQEAYAYASQKEGCVIVDVREEEELSHARIPGALFLPLSRLFQDHDILQDKEKLFFICASGGRSVMAAGFAEMKGNTEVYNVQGGMIAWISAGLPTE